MNCSILEINYDCGTVSTFPRSVSRAVEEISVENVVRGDRNGSDCFNPTVFKRGVFVAVVKSKKTCNLSLTGQQKVKIDPKLAVFYLSLGPRKTERIPRRDARETHVTCVTTKLLLAKPRIFSDLPAFLGPNGI